MQPHVPPTCSADLSYPGYQGCLPIPTRSDGSAYTVNDVQMLPHKLAALLIGKPCRSTPVFYLSIYLPPLLCTCLPNLFSTSSLLTICTCSLSLRACLSPESPSTYLSTELTACPFTDRRAPASC
eukprot:5968386-Pleurochrysis_carterae.AAC.1